MSAAAALIAYPVAALVLYVLLRSSIAERFVARPREDRWHKRATPYFGGVGIFAGFAAGILAAVAVGAVAGSHEEVLGILAGCAVLFVAGLLDDVFGLPPIAKLAAQFAAAAVVLSSGLKVTIVSNHWLGLALATLWLVGLTNAFNMLDNMDGLAATLAAIAALFFAIDAATFHRERHRPRPRARAVQRMPRIPPVQPAPRRRGSDVHGRLRQPGARLRARRVRDRVDAQGRADDGRDADPAAARSSPCRSSTRRSSRSCGCSRAGPSTRAGATTRRTGSSTTASPTGAP